MTHISTTPQMTYRPDVGGFVVESVVYGGQLVTGGHSNLKRYVNFVALADSEAEAMAICDRLRNHIAKSPDPRKAKA